MHIGRGLAAVATFAAAVVGAAGPARADDPDQSAQAPPAEPPAASATPNGISGTFLAVEEGDPPAQWVFTSCGDNCTEVTLPDGRARLVYMELGQWRMDDLDNVNAVKCTADGSEHLGTAHYSWDPTTLTGEAWATDDTGACGETAGTDTDSVPFSLTPAP
ncbi:hypothetical protein [Mycobacterium branderi]|uniref:Lipoprotein LppP n=1 Tax=Mycobacterium branderi TaxID=43348 RepID=A0A7I7W5M9_9MYCO|nr:hypothetical protein [Mycobacterium branderi]MCV7233779.1 hypothetical protein [Mycobacterium branderi]ORA39678.1 hypothetical protein BST20_09285 [Mycobacterium branderi]BBZ11743.1 hypothetical protein MBRA_19380 [Mycobacterium branderi]